MHPLFNDDDTPERKVHFTCFCIRCKPDDRSVWFVEAAVDDLLYVNKMFIGRHLTFPFALHYPPSAQWSRVAGSTGVSHAASSSSTSAGAVLPSYDDLPSSARVAWQVFHLMSGAWHIDHNHCLQRFPRPPSDNAQDANAHTSSVPEQLSSVESVPDADTPTQIYPTQSHVDSSIPDQTTQGNGGDVIMDSDL